MLFKNILKPFIKIYNDKLLYLLMINWNILCSYSEYTFPYNLNTIDNQTILTISVYYNASLYIQSYLQYILNHINIFMGKHTIDKINIYTQLALYK